MNPLEINIPEKRPVQFLFSVAESAQIPRASYKEIAFCGASNVGKSSLLNALCRQKNLARTSKTPGRTQLLNFFAGPPETVLVDVPGYGFALAPDDVRKSWSPLLLDYLESRQNMLKVALLFDARRFLRVQDLDVVRLLQDFALPYFFVVTKLDKLNKTEGELLQKRIAEQMGESCEVILTSAKSRSGVDALDWVVRDWCAPKK
ncbi:putative GTP-binding protein EngB [Alphaproteobacteria bacterium]|nr:putative GTP-binding protein EngB [Alphaproteobacteria bacterium]GHS96617.1 putative GTP-binding protein EngB [Alphaproteobacteria bacterium]